MFPNQYAIALNQYMFKFMGADKFEKNKDIIERLGHQIITENDFKNWMTLLNDVYQIVSDDYRIYFEDKGFTID